MKTGELVYIKKTAPGRNYVTGRSAYTGRLGYIKGLDYAKNGAIALITTAFETLPSFTFEIDEVMRVQK